MSLRAEARGLLSAAWSAKSITFMLIVPRLDSINEDIPTSGELSKAVSNGIDFLQNRARMMGNTEVTFSGFVPTNPLVLSEFGASILGTLGDDERRLRISPPENGRKRLSLH